MYPSGRNGAIHGRSSPTIRLGFDIHYDLSLVAEACQAISLAFARTPNAAVVDLGGRAALRFQNEAPAGDSYVGFEGTPWHVHGAPLFADHQGNNTQVTYLDLLFGLADGTILVCELWRDGGLVDRWLVHRDFMDEARWLNEGDELRLWRAVSGR